MKNNDHPQEGGNRMSVTLTSGQRDTIKRIARAQQVSIAWVIRRAVDLYISSQAPLFANVAAEDRFK